MVRAHVKRNQIMQYTVGPVNREVGYNWEFYWLRKGDLVRIGWHQELIQMGPSEYCKGSLEYLSARAIVLEHLHTIALQDLDILKIYKVSLVFLVWILDIIS